MIKGEVRVGGVRGVGARQGRQPKAQFTHRKKLLKIRSVFSFPRSKVAFT
jgi:hypothetical protein